MSDDNTPPEWLEQIRQGDEAAEQEAWDEYAERLLRFAKRKLASMPRRAVDEEDVVLSAMNSFIIGVRGGQLEPRDSNELWKLLATITMRKATKYLRQHYAVKRGQGAVRGESVFFDFVKPDDPSNGLSQVHDRDSLPEVSSTLLEMCEQKYAALTPELKEFAQLRLEGYEQKEIAERLGCSEITVRRRLTQIRERWSEAERD